MFFRRVRAVFLILVAVCLSGCDNNNGISIDTGQITISETTEVTTVAKPPTKATTESEIETVDSNDDFVYPDDPLASADSLMDLVFKAKQRLYELDEITSDMSYYGFGLVDVDFDNFPELFCFFNNGFTNFEGCKLYSLKEETFCKLLTEFTASFLNSDRYGHSKFMIKDGFKDRRLIIYTVKPDVAQHEIIDISEITLENGEYFYNKLFKSIIIFKYYDNGSDNESYYINSIKTNFDEYEIAIEDFTKDLIPATYLYEDIDYHCGNVNKKQKFIEDYDLLYVKYDEYIKTLK